MKNIKTLASFKTKTISKCIAFSLLMIASSQASALDVSLCAGETTKTMADDSVVKVWGYGIDNGSPNCDSATVPGPQLTVPVGDTALNITLRNTLSDAVSVMIPGMKGTAGNTPVFFNDGTFYADGVTPRMRVRSLVAETATGASTLYSFAAKAGTHLYQSGTHPSVQVQMGLYGATVQDAAAGQAYTDVNYDNDVVMLYSEIDPAMHDAIAGTADGFTAATYGPGGAVTSTIGYKARYYLVNGESYTPGSSVVAGDKGDRILIRFLNAGLESHVPVLQGKHMSLVAEYGNKYPQAREQYSVLLAAGVTKDAIFTPSSGGTYALYDRRLRLTNGAQAGPGGLMSMLSVTEPVVANPATAVDDSASTDEDAAVTIDVLLNDTDAVASSIEISTQPANGNAVVNAATNDVTYTPNVNFNGDNAFSYTVRNVDGVVSNTAVVTVTVAPVNDTPVAANDTYDVVVSSTTTLTVLANDSDVDMDTLSTTVVVGTEPTLGTLTSNPDGSFTYVANAVAGSDSFSYTVSDGALSATATVNITVSDAVNQAPVAVDDYAKVTRATGSSPTSVTIVVSSNDSDADGTLDLASVAIATAPSKGTVVVEADGSITYSPKAGFSGSDAFSYTINDNDGATSNEAVVRVDVVR